MGVEIERKFLLQSDSWQADADAGEYYHQGYLSTTPERVVRVRQMGEKENPRKSHESGPLVC